MSNSNLGLYLFILFSVTFLSPHDCSHEFLPLPKQYDKALFIFGDSLFDVGNNNYIINTSIIAQANFWPYGETFFKFPTGRWSDGRVIPDFIAEYANLPLILPYLYPGNKDFTKGINFASAGAGVLDETARGFVISFKTQLSYFNNVERILRKKLGNVEAKTLLSRAVYLISIGSNDYGAFTADSKLFQSYSFKQYVDLVIGNLTFVIQEIHEKGGRKFAVLNVGPVNRLPAVKAAIVSRGRDAKVEEVMKLVELHNKQLHRTLQKLTGKLKGFVYSFIDFYTLANEIIINPAKYGLKEVKIACCGIGAFRGRNSCGGKRGIKEYELCENPNEYFFFDSNHGTDRGHQILAEIIWSENSNITTPLNVKSLFSDKIEVIEDSV